MTLTLTFDLLLKKLNLGYNFWTKRDKAFILHMLVPCDKTFLSIPKNLTLWPWPWLLTFFWKKNLTLAITFEPRETRLYSTGVYSLWQDLSVHTKNFDLMTLTLTFDLLLKKLNLDHNFWTKSDWALILHTFIPCDDPSLMIPIFFTLWP